MKLHTLAAAAVLAFTVAAPAVAADSNISVSLQSPLAAKVKVVAGGAVFNCADSACVAVSAPDQALTVATCKAVAKKAGAVAAFAGERRGLQAPDLARCNGAPAATVTASN